MTTLTFFKPLIHTVKKYLKPSHNYYIEPAKTPPALEVNSNRDIISWRPKAAFKLQTLVKLDFGQNYVYKFLILFNK